MAKTVDDCRSRSSTDASRQCRIRTQHIKILSSFNVSVEQEAVRPLLDQFAVAARTPNYDGQRASHRLDDDPASSLAPGRVSAIDECIQRSEKVASLNLSGVEEFDCLAVAQVLPKNTGAHEAYLHASLGKVSI